MGMVTSHGALGFLMLVAGSLKNGSDKALSHYGGGHRPQQHQRTLRQEGPEELLRPKEVEPRSDELGVLRKLPMPPMPCTTAGLEVSSWPRVLTAGQNSASD